MRRRFKKKDEKSKQEVAVDNVDSLLTVNILADSRCGRDVLINDS